jgi:energy-coupling factor transporter ATP-binding protein EcfA2
VPQDIITFDKIYYSYPRTKKWVLKGIDFSVKTGEFLAVMGENGAGKTSFCKLINGIIPNVYGGQLSGTVTVDGVNTANSTVSQLAQKAGMVLDDPDAQIFTSSVREEAAFGPGNLLLPAREIEERVKWALSAVSLDGYEQRQPVTLSGGEKQRLAIASAFAMRTKILILDEPLCRLDHAGVQEVITTLL